VVQVFFRLVQHLKIGCSLMNCGGLEESANFRWRDSFLRLTRRVLSADWGMQAQARAHALLPGALFSLSFFNLGPDTGEGFASELTHLDVE
jgi:hypothetical protein